MIEKNHDGEKDAEKHEKESTVLKKEKGELEKIGNEYKQHILKLENEIVIIETETEAKEKKIRTISHEYKILETKLSVLKDEKEVLDAQVKSFEIKVQFEENDPNNCETVLTSLSLEEELNACNVDIVKTFKCKKCEQKFCSKSDLKKHVDNVHVMEEKFILASLEGMVASQTAKIATSINKLTEKEYSDKRKPCLCKSFCMINHWKQNYKKAYSSTAIAKFAEIKTSKSENGEVEVVSE